MKYSSLIDNVSSKKWGINIQEAYLFDWIYSLPSWAESINISGITYFFASRNKACSELPLITDKPDTMYRFYKSLEKKCLIKIKKLDGKEYISLTEKSKKWNRQSDNSEKNPNELGKKSENNSEKNPTYNIISNNNIINDNTPVGGKSKDFHSKFIKIYFDWFLEKFNSKPKITAADAKAAKELINHFLNAQQDPLESLGAIFLHWDRLDTFTQNCVDLRKLNSNINSIVQQLTKKTRKNDKFDESIKRNFSDKQANDEWFSREWKSSIDR